MTGVTNLLRNEVEESPLVRHARRELEIIGQFDEDPEFAESLVAIVKAFTRYGHSGASAHEAANMLDKLLRYKPLGPVTDNPDEWSQVPPDFGPPYDREPIWQNVRDSSCFSKDGGRTYYDIDGDRSVTLISDRHDAA
jgi:hypothetical protein